MNLHHPCKNCIVRPICNCSCKNKTYYRDQITESHLIHWTFGILVALLISVYICSCYYTLWSLATIPFVWGASQMVMYHVRDIISLKSTNKWELIVLMVILPSTSALLLLAVVSDKYINKYGPGDQ